VRLSVVEDMAHTHNVADTRERLWKDLAAWLTVAKRHADTQ